jgi:hypothetical protein
METSVLETIPSGWDDARDVPFFRITAGLFSADFCFGAGVLLAANDEDAGALVAVPALRR